MIRSVHKPGSLALSLLLVACGGIEGTGSPQAGVEGTGFTDGVVSGFGSVFVNGVEYATTRARILADGMPAPEQALQVGMQVTVSGDVDSDGRHGTAHRVEFDRLALAPIDAIESNGRRLLILGQVVNINDDTALVNATRQSLQPGDLCVLSGLRSATGEILATYLERQDASYEPGVTVVDIEGVVSDLGTETFQLGGLTVDYRNAVIDKTEGLLENGALVEVAGQRAASGGSLVAQAGRVKKSAVSAPLGEDVVVDGLITQFNGMADFVLNGRRVNAASAQRTDQTTLEPANDARITVHGQIDPQGVLQASRYALRPPSTIIYDGRVDTVDPAGNHVSLLNVPVTALPETQFRDGSSAGERSFDLASLQPGDYVELRVFRDVAGNRLAGRIERTRPHEQPGILSGSTSVESLGRMRVSNTPAVGVTGPVDGFDAAADTVRIAGVTTTTNMLLTRFTGRDGNVVTSAEFYAGLKAGDVLTADGTESSGGGVDASSIGYAN